MTTATLKKRGLLTASEAYSISIMVAGRSGAGEVAERHILIHQLRETETERKTHTHRLRHTERNRWRQRD